MTDAGSLKLNSTSHNHLEEHDNLEYDVGSKPLKGTSYPITDVGAGTNGA